jgi:hypothetical protein
MNDLRFTALTERLLRAGVAPRHARRAVQELRAHHADVVAELRAAGVPPAECERLAAERVGPDEAFVRDMLARPELRSWASRRPFVAFGLLPLLAFIGLFVLSVLLVIGAFAAVGHGRGLLWPPLEQALRWVGSLLFFVAMWVAPLAAAGAACLLAARQRIAARWAIVGVLLVGLLRALINGRLDVAAPFHGSISVGIGWRWPHLLPADGWRAAILIPAVLLPYLWWLRSRGAHAARRRN